jgi:hypothetical protein
MSGVLERMAKRARGALPMVEPRSLPLFAPSAAGLGRREIPAAGIQEVFAEVESSQSDVDSSPRKRRGAPIEEDEPGTVLDENSKALSSREPVRRTTARESGRGENSEQQAGEPRPRRPESQQATNSSQLESGGKVVPTQQQLSAENNRSGMGVAEPQEAQKFSAQAAPVKAVISEAQEEKLFTSKLVERTVEKEESSDEIATPARSGAGAARRRQQQELRGAARNDAPAATSASPTEQRTEIHISIGSIELRAPRVEARPQAVPFRPRVTLDDFLGRKPEAGA